MNKFYQILWIFLAFVPVQAKVKLPSLIGDCMVLQQNSDVLIWGKAAPGKNVLVATSWIRGHRMVKVNSQGNWEAVIHTPAASLKEYSITLSDGEPVTLKHILIGEVWLCTGQSNMVMPLKGFDYCPVYKSNEVIADASNHPAIRLITLKPKVSLEPRDTTEGDWKICSSENAPNFSAVAYHYALALQNSLHIPVGIIVAAWGGSRVEGWLPKEILQTYQNESLDMSDKDKRPVYLRPMLMYNALLYPCRKYAIKGFIWYQGESNVTSSQTYAERLVTMVSHWRKLWKRDDLPFYMVEIAPFACGYKKDGLIGALLREAQYKASLLISHCGLVGTNDLVEENEYPQVHPSHKKEIGERLAYLSLSKQYGHKELEIEYPAYAGMKIARDTISVSFQHADRGLSPWVNIQGFEVSGNDKVFYPATAVLDSKEHTVIVSSEKVTAPVAVRYCFRNFLKGNLVGMGNLPVRPFRSDNW
jgi:sialate O-acetylesterase